MQKSWESEKGCQLELQCLGREWCWLWTQVSLTYYPLHPSSLRAFTAQHHHHTISVFASAKLLLLSLAYIITAGPQKPQLQNSQPEQMGRRSRTMAVRVNERLPINKPPIHLVLVPRHWTIPQWALMLTGTLDNVLPLDDFGLLSAVDLHSVLTELNQSYCTFTTCLNFSKHTPRKNDLVFYFQSEIFCVVSWKKMVHGNVLFLNWYFCFQTPSALTAVTTFLVCTSTKSSASNSAEVMFRCSVFALLVTWELRSI